MKSAFAVQKENSQKSSLKLRVKLTPGKVNKAKKKEKKVTPKAKPEKKRASSRTTTKQNNKSKKGVAESEKTSDGEKSPIRKQSPKASTGGKQQKVDKKTSPKTSQKSSKTIKNAVKNKAPQKKAGKKSPNKKTDQSPAKESTNHGKKSPSPAKKKSVQVLSPAKDTSSTKSPTKESRAKSQKNSPTKATSPQRPSRKKSPSSSSAKGASHGKSTTSTPIRGKTSAKSKTSPKSETKSKTPPSSKKASPKTPNNSQKKLTSPKGPSSNKSPISSPVKGTSPVKSTTPIKGKTSAKRKASPKSKTSAKSKTPLSTKKSGQNVGKNVAKTTAEKALELTPMSEMRATKEASADTMLVKITPLKSRQGSGNSSSPQKKRKNSTTSSKNSKKLKIKLIPRNVPSKTNASPPKRGESPSIVNSSTPRNGPLGKNGPTTVTDSGTESALLFEWLISPVTPQNFFDNLWEKKPLLVRRHKPLYFQGLFTTVEFNSILKENDIQYGKHLDVTSYTDGKRETHNPEGRAHAPVVWDYYNNGCSLRMLNPQTYSAKVWKLLSTLQEHFGSFCGANIYLTPADTQGFAPHYDDIEAFVLQLEGRKRWRLYSPRSDNEVLPRFSSENFTDAEIGAPILDTVLEEGDVLYFPRGYIHQATPPADTHSLHLTLSTCQKNTWGDFMEKIVNGALQTAIEEDLNFRLSVPRDFLNFMGIMNSDMEDEKRAAFISKIGELFQKLAFYSPVDDAADQVGMNLLHSSLPPVLTDEEMACMIYATKLDFVNGEFVGNSNLLSEETEVQLIRRGVLRLITHEDEIQVHHCVENSRVYHGKPCQFFVIPPESALGVEFLIRQYPNFVRVEDLPLEGELRGKEVELASLLFEKGLIRTRHPLNTDTDDER